MDSDCICTTLRQAAALTTAQYDAALAPVGIKVTMFRLLRRIDGAGAVTISELAEIVGLDRSTLGRNLRVLERQGLVEADVGQDARARLVTLTAAGREALARAEPLWHAAQQRHEEAIGPETIALIKAAMGRLAQADQVVGPQK